MTRARGMLLSVALFLVSLLSYGCATMLAGGAAAGGTLVYTEGRLQRDYEAGLDRTFEASVDALDSLDMDIEERSQKVADASIKAMDGDTTVWVNLESGEEATTRVTVRYGLFGDRDASERIHRAIALRL